MRTRHGSKMRTPGQHVDSQGPRKNVADDRRNAAGSNIAEQELGLQKNSLGKDTGEQARSPASGSHTASCTWN